MPTGLGVCVVRLAGDVARGLAAHPGSRGCGGIGRSGRGVRTPGDRDRYRHRRCRKGRERERAPKPVLCKERRNIHARRGDHHIRGRLVWKRGGVEPGGRGSGDEAWRLRASGRLPQDQRSAHLRRR
jgi:hypothetical protein